MGLACTTQGRRGFSQNINQGPLIEAYIGQVWTAIAPISVNNEIVSLSANKIDKQIKTFLCTNPEKLKKNCIGKKIQTNKIQFPLFQFKPIV